MDLDSTLCYCFHIKKRKIVNFVKQTRPRRASQIAECFSAGTGCGWCIPFLKRIHRDVIAGQVVESDDISDADYEAMRREYRTALKDGVREPNSLNQEEFSPEVEAMLDRLACAARAEAELESEDDDWDVSGYFSRPATTDPEPDDLDEPS